MVAPGTFIRLAEEIGLIVPLGEWVIIKRMRDGGWMAGRSQGRGQPFGRSNQKSGTGECYRERPCHFGFAGRALRTRDYGDDLLHNSEATLAMLYHLRALGVQIAMDGFGTGYSSLSYLQRFPFDKVKIDRSFVNIAENAGSINIVRAVAALAQGLGIQATA
jgi:EAL domain-containing protein (putative c-di-GMP-specific phosphodiesterase class I)